MLECYPSSGISILTGSNNVLKNNNLVNNKNVILKHRHNNTEHSILYSSSIIYLVPLGFRVCFYLSHLEAAE